MGCWNETCRLSNLQITADDEVVVALLVKQAEDVQRFFPCYYNTNYAPLCLPVVGKYDDYGGVKSVKEPVHTMKLLEALDFVDADGNEYNFSTIRNLVEEITSSAMYLVHNGEKYKLECAFYHKSLYDKLVETMTKQTPCNNSTPLADLYANKLKTFEEKFLEFEKKSASEDVESLMDVWSVRDNYRSVFKVTPFGFSFMTKSSRILNVNELRGFHEELVNYIMFALALSAGRYGFDTVSGAGGQDTSVFVQRIVAKFVLEFTENNERYNTENDIYWWTND